MKTKIKMTKTASVQTKIRKAGDVLEVQPHLAAILVRRGLAVLFSEAEEAPKKKAKPKKAKNKAKPKKAKNKEGEAGE